MAAAQEEVGLGQDEHVEVVNAEAVGEEAAVEVGTVEGAKEGCAEWARATVVVQMAPEVTRADRTAMQVAAMDVVRVTAALAKVDR